MFKAGIIYISYLLFAMNFTSCTYKSQNHGVNIEDNMIAQVKEKLANDNLLTSDLTNILGPYSTIYRIDDDISILYISMVRTTPPIKKDYASDLLIYEFIAQDNKIIKLNEYDQLNEISLNKGKTIHEEKRFSVIKQIFGNIGRIAGTSYE